MQLDIVNALIGAVVVISGIAVLFALILGFKAIGVWVRSTFKGNSYPTKEEMAEFKELAEAVKMKMKSTEAPAGK